MNAPATSSPRPSATLDDLARVPEHLVAEIVDGELWTSPRPGARHARAASKLGAVLDGPFDAGDEGPGGWIILIEPELHLGGDVLVPDLAGWRRERMPILLDVAAFTIAPDWVCEVLSPNNAGRDRLMKIPRYARHGVEWLWLVDPRERLIEVYRRQGEGWLTEGGFNGEGKARLAPFEAADLGYEALWAE